MDAVEISVQHIFILLITCYSCLWSRSIRIISWPTTGVYWITLEKGQEYNRSKGVQDLTLNQITFYTWAKHFNWQTFEHYVERALGIAGLRPSKNINVLLSASLRVSMEWLGGGGGGRPWYWWMTLSPSMCMCVYTHTGVFTHSIVRICVCTHMVEPWSPLYLGHILAGAGCEKCFAVWVDRVFGNWAIVILTIALNPYILKISLKCA